MAVPFLVSRSTPPAVLRLLGGGRGLERAASLTASTSKRRYLSTIAPRVHQRCPAYAPMITSPLCCQRRCYTASSSSGDEQVSGNITEETSRIAEVMGEEGVNVDEVATPISEVIERENDIENAPEVIKEDLNQPSEPPSSSLQTSDAAAATALVAETLADFPNPTPKVLIPPYRPPIPMMPIPALHSINHREHPLLRQLTPHFMKHGERATAQATMQRILQILRTKPAPRVGKYALVPNAPDLSQLPSDPVAYIQTAIDSVAPLFKMRSTRGSGGSTVQIPSPLPVKARRRKAMEWMLSAADGKKRLKSLPERFAEEVEAVVLGTSSCWEKRIAVHKLAVTNRANVGTGSMKKMKRRL
ncbi:37S ribosomal protein S7 [Drechslerella dactyloides]|uniref:37S ribosomal protein S7 n=1 Tax=Drechslerella dactyloides TaxID=74499 RepID=A0AAD6NID5_DREDA|nr:37S ribosomal protein S7 [Drechslerella dactyloides]